MGMVNSMLDPAVFCLPVCDGCGDWLVGRSVYAIVGPGRGVGVGDRVHDCESV